MGYDGYLAVISRDPVPTARLTKDQVQAQRRADAHCDVLKALGAVKFLDNPERFTRNNNPDVSDKEVPTLREAIRVAHDWGGPAHYYGYVNADIILGPLFLNNLTGAKKSGAEIVILHRTDVDNLNAAVAINNSDNPEESKIGKKVNPRNSADGIFMTKEVLGDFFDTFPKFVIAEPWWDTAFIYWAKQSDYLVWHLSDNEALHVKHPQQWSFSTKGSRRAHELYVKLMETWPRD